MGRRAVTELKIKVRPAYEGWAIECEPPLETLYFRSGGKAESAARRLALRLCGEGRDVSLVVMDREHNVIGTQLYFGLCDAESGAREITMETARNDR